MLPVALSMLFVALIHHGQQMSLLYFQTHIFLLLLLPDVKCLHLWFCPHPKKYLSFFKVLKS